MHNKLYSHTKLRHTYSPKHAQISFLEITKIGFLGFITIVLLMIFLFLTSTTSTAGHALNKALRGFDTTMQAYSRITYDIADSNADMSQKSVSIPTTNLGYQKNIVAVSDTSNFALHR